MSHSICIIHVATSRFPNQRLLAWHISTCNSNSSCGCRGLPRHTIMWNSLGSTWKSMSDSGEHWKGAPHSWENWKGVPPFVSRQCFPNSGVARVWPLCGPPPRRDVKYPIHDGSCLLLWRPPPPYRGRCDLSDPGSYLCLPSYPLTFASSCGRGGLLRSWGLPPISCIRPRMKSVHTCSGGIPPSPSGSGVIPPSPPCYCMLCAGSAHCSGGAPSSVTWSGPPLSRICMPCVGSARC